jgi:hypothetical protein
MKAIDILGVRFFLFAMGLVSRIVRPAHLRARRFGVRRAYETAA